MSNETETPPSTRGIEEVLDSDVKQRQEKSEVIVLLDEIRYDKQARRDLDDVLQRIKALKPSRERALAVTKVQEAVMWLGMDLKRLNEPNPYPQSYNPDSPVVEKTADGLKL